MLSIVFFAAALVVCQANSIEYYSYSPSVGGGSGTSFSSSGEGSITGIKVWAHSYYYVSGIQLRYGTRWGKVLGRISTIEHRMDLFEGEAFIQVSGKYGSYINQLFFVTNRGRFLMAGRSSQTAFNFYPKHPESELRLLSGRDNGYALTSLGAHWGTVSMLSIVIFAAALVVCLANSTEYYSYSPSVGGGSGTSFSSSGEGSITGIKVWVHSYSHISGIQLRYGTRWGKVLGRISTTEHRMDLYEGEAFIQNEMYVDVCMLILQVSGQYYLYNYIYQLIFVTNRGRFLMAGHSQQFTFNFYGKHPEAELRLLSGRTNGYGITSLGAHWGTVSDAYNSSGEGSITGIKVWAHYYSYVSGIQLRYGTRWGRVIGRIGSTEQRMDLFEGEAFIQVQMCLYYVFLNQYILFIHSIVLTVIFYHYKNEMYVDVCMLILQVSGQYQSHGYIYQLIFVTNRGRFLMAGHSQQTAFNFYAKHPEAELRLLSGRTNGYALTSLGAHWGIVSDAYKSVTAATTTYALSST
ncbi:Zymogen granule membrane protein 16 [Merluccius polli]|uniref:Zymogen granule membrane protein 16 n=1 Tax=Merluccius polli TaxID=89951 RepID=A0AA47N8Y1_MERPO|nr:Zymogen granule membrane protein 16 [Merluccius polli]